MSATLLETNSLDERRGSVWDYISPSRLNCWLSCPLKFKLRYIDGIKSPSTPALFLGKHVHSGLEIFYRHKMLGITLMPEDVAGRMVDAWDQAVAEENISFKTLNDELSLKKQSVDLVAAYLAQIPDDEPAPTAVEVRMETPLVDPFTGEDLGIPMLGIVDLVLASDEGPVIIDFKTSSRSAPPFEVTHEVQLSTYSYLHRQMTGQREAGLEIRSLVKTRKPKIESHDYSARSDRHLARLFAIIREYLDSLDSGKFNFRPGWGCSMCDFRDGSHCRTWNP
jgi:putative RecB family exonuclease